jgi:hypothetical protein
LRFIKNNPKWSIVKLYPRYNSIFMANFLLLVPGLAGLDTGYFMDKVGQ